MLLSILALCCFIVATLIALTIEKSWWRFFLALGLTLLVLASVVGGGVTIR